MRSRRLLFDVETNGLLPQIVDPPYCMDRVHCLWIRDVDNGDVWDFARHAERDDLSEGFEMLEGAEWVIGHNIVDFDLKAIRIVYPDFSPRGRIYDTLVMSRMVFADVKEGDFRLAAKGQLEGRLIGRHGLEAWGQRLGLHKGDYSKERVAELKEKHKEGGLAAPTDEELHYYVWGEWNPAQHEYCGLDTKVNELLFNKIEDEEWSHDATVLEHNIHALMVQQEHNGFYFNIPKAEKLAEHLRGEYDRLADEATAQIGRWYRPCKVQTDTSRTEFGEDKSRRTWGDVTLPKRTMDFSKSNAKLIAAGETSKLRPNTVEGRPFVKVELRDFNPNSRLQIIDRLKTLYGWEPQDFTEKGTPRVDDEILRNLADHIPLADTLAEVFFMKKRLGQVADGKNGWLKLVREDKRIHGRVNVGGTVSGRATHASPNISQVPGVKPKEFKDHQKGVDFIRDHKPYIVKAEWKEQKGEWEILTRGRTGDYGWDCRELFIVPDGYELVGCDLSGIEFRCLANLTYPFDDGELVDVVLNGDIHQRNADLAGISRSVAKRLLYACMYGGGDAKLGSIVEPLSSEARQRTLGKQLRAKLMAAMPSLSKAIKKIHLEMRQNRGTIAGLDGRRLYVRSKHSALNLRLQSDGALIAKKWCLLIDDMFYDEGWEHNIDAEYAFNSWSHDEVQVAVRKDLADAAADIMEDAAPLAGKHFNFACPVSAEAKIGPHWAATH